MSTHYRVSFSNGRWLVKSKKEESRHPTQQQAIDWAKARACRDRGRVTWLDRDGNVQAQVSYRPPRMSLATIALIVLVLLLEFWSVTQML